MACPHNVSSLVDTFDHDRLKTIALWACFALLVSLSITLVAFIFETPWLYATNIGPWSLVSLNVRGIMRRFLISAPLLSAISIVMQYGNRHDACELFGPFACIILVQLLVLLVPLHELITSMVAALFALVEGIGRWIGEEIQAASVSVTNHQHRTSSSAASISGSISDTATAAQTATTDATVQDRPQAGKQHRHSIEARVRERLASDAGRARQRGERRDEIALLQQQNWNWWTRYQIALGRPASDVQGPARRPYKP